MLAIMRALVPEDLHRNGHARQRQSITAITRALAASALGVLHKGLLDPVAHIRAKWPDDGLAAYVAKAASSPAKLDEPGWAQELAHSVVADFVSALGPASAGAALFEQGLQLAFDRDGQVRVPSFVTELGNAGFVAAGAEIPVHEAALAPPAVLDPRKLAAIVVLTREMADSSNSEKSIADLLFRSVGRQLDECLFDANPGDAERPAGLRHGIAAIPASTATDPWQAFAEDLGSLAQAVSAVAGNVPVCFVCSLGRAIKIDLRARESDKFSVLASGATVNDLLCVAPSALVSITGATPDIEASSTPVLHMETVPQPVGTAAPGRSLYQTDAIALKTRWPVTWALRDSRGFAWIDGTATPTKW